MLDPASARRVKTPLAKPAGKDVAPTTAATLRETVESIVVAFVLAFMFRTFEAEAFVIPTGSMAPTLQGRHRDVTCPECGYQYRTSASSEVEDSRQGARPVIKISCPMCRWEIDTSPGSPGAQQYPAYNGDRILVSKFAYQFAEPKRWDVVVFKFPGNAKMNYIKRLVGLPKESVRIEHGDIFTRAEESRGPFVIERKPPRKAQAMAQMVYDNDFVVDAMTKAGWPLRWQPWPVNQTAGAAAWQSPDGGRSYVIDSAAAGPRWLRYQHFVPNMIVWNEIESDNLARQAQTRPQLITDFYAYNDFYTQGALVPAAPGLHWVGDLMLKCQVDVQSADASGGKLLFDLVEGERHFRATIDATTGQAELAIVQIDGQPLSGYSPKASTPVHIGGSHAIDFANFDDQLYLWVDGQQIAFDTTTEYPSLGIVRPQANLSRDDAGDLAPAGVGAEHVSATVQHIKLLRDVYYIADQVDGSNRRARGEFINDYGGSLPDALPESLSDFFSDPRRWSSPTNDSPFDGRLAVDFAMKADQFFVLGDNSPQSADSRLWQNGHYVDRDLLIGKALCIYWPHGWPTPGSFSIKQFGADFRFPFYPNFKRMRFIE